MWPVNNLLQHHIDFVQYSPRNKLHLLSNLSVTFAALFKAIKALLYSFVMVVIGVVVILMVVIGVVVIVMVVIGVVVFVMVVIGVVVIGAMGQWSL